MSSKAKTKLALVPVTVRDNRNLKPRLRTPSPDPVPPAKPASRSLAHYCDLLDFDILSTENLPQNTLWIDAGCGSAQALKELEAKRPDVHRVGIIDPSQASSSMPLEDSIEIIHARLPHEIERLEHVRGQVGLITDVYGVVSLAADPLEALLAECRLLRSDGQAVIITGASRFGQERDWIQLSKLWAEHTGGSRIRFEELRTFAADTHHWKSALKIVVEGSREGFTPSEAASALRPRGLRAVNPLNPTAPAIPHLSLRQLTELVSE
jgi:SAM-dependent methyltransferase